MEKLSQRDSRWKDIKLGFSDQTIGGYGCTITALAMILGTTPIVVNDRLKAVNGFSDGSTVGKGNLVVWDAIAKAFPGAQVHRVWNYNNDDVAANVPNVLVEVDGKPIGGYRHWVVYRGGQKMYDPWDGQEKSTGSYPNPLSYCIVKPPTTKPEEVVCDKKSVRDMLVDKATKFDAFIQAGFDSVQKVLDIIEGHKSRATTLERERDEARSATAVEKQKAENAKNDLANKTTEWQQRENSLLAQIDELKKTNPDLEKVKTEYETQISVERDSKEKAVKKMNETLVANSKLLAENDKLSKQTLDKFTLWELWTLGLKKIIPFLKKTKLK